MMRSSLLLLVCLLVMLAGEADAKEPVWNATLGEGNSNFVNVAISSDGQYTVAGVMGDTEKLYLFDRDDSGEYLWEYDPGSNIASVDISSNGDYMVAGYNELSFFDKDSNTPLWSYDISPWVNCVSMSSDGEYIAVGSQGEINLFDKDSSTPLWTYSTDAGIESIEISSDGEYIIAGGDYNIYLFDKDSNTPLWSYETENSVGPVDISSDGEYMVVGETGNNEKDNYLFFFEQSSNEPLWTYDSEYDTSIESVAISSDGGYIMAGDGDRARLFYNNSNNPIWTYICAQSVSSVDISLDGSRFLVGCSGQNTDNVNLFGSNSNIPLWSHEIETYGTGGVWTATISLDGEYSAVGTKDFPELLLFNNNVPPTSHIDSIFPNPVRFDGIATFNGSGSDIDGVIIGYEWKSSIDGFLSDHQNFTASDFTIGKHIISLRVQDDDYEWSEWYTVELDVAPNSPPIAVIDSIFPSPARFDAEVTFNGSGSDSDGTVVAYEWESSHDGFLSDEKDFSMTDLLENHHHTISFRVQDNDGVWSDWSTEGLYVYSNVFPVATIDSISPSPARIDSEVTFNGTGSDSDGTVIAYQWTSHRDGFLSDEKDFSTTNLSAGDNYAHTITFSVQDNDGAWSSSSLTLFVYPNAPPLAVIDSIEPSQAKEGTTVSFSGTGSDSDGTIVAYHWESSIDGELSTNEDFSSSDLSLGHHTISFRVQDNDGAWSSPASGENGSVPVPWIYAVPVASASHWNDGSNESEPGESVMFRGTGSDEDGSVVKYEWDFNGDGAYEYSSSNDGDTSYTFNLEGTYTAVLRITDNDGFTGTDSRIITVSKAGDDGDGDDGDGDDGGGGIPALSVITTMAAVAVMALRRRPE